MPGARKCSKTLHRLRLFSIVRRRLHGDLIYKYKIMHGLLDFSWGALGFEVILSRFTNSNVKPVAVNMHSEFKYFRTVINCQRR